MRGRPGPVREGNARPVFDIIEGHFSRYRLKRPPLQEDAERAARERLQGLIETGHYGSLWVVEGWPKSEEVEFGVALQMDKISIVKFSIEKEYRGVIQDKHAAEDQKGPTPNPPFGPRARDRKLEGVIIEIFNSHRILRFGDAFD